MDNALSSDIQRDDGPRRWCDWRPKVKRPTCSCIRTDQPPRRPDPAIYSQLRLLSLGQPTSWESPDIQSNWWDAWRFMDNIEVRVRNESGEASAVNTLVRVHWAVFGIGTPFSPLGDRMISLGFEPDFRLLYFPIDQAVRDLGNDVSLRVTISHPHDKDTDNNVGFQAIHGLRTSAASRTPSMNFTVVNPSAVAQTIKLVVLPNEIGGVVTPAIRPFAPNEQITATLTANVPAAIVPPAGGDVLKDVTVVGYDGAGNVIGGVTLLVRVDS